MGKRRFVRWLILALPVAAVLAAPASAASPQPSVYLALGDSVAAGVGAQPAATEGYVAELHGLLTAARRCGGGQALGCRVDLVNLAVPAATTSTLISQQLPVAVSLLQERNGNSTPVDDVALVTIDIGGNDVFGPILSACANPQAPSCLATIQTTLTQVAANYQTILSAPRAAAGPDATIAVMTYYNPLPACQLSALTPLADLVLEGGAPLPAGLNDIIRSQATAVDAVVAETAPLIGVDDLVGGTDCLHPNNSGHDDIASAFAQVIDVSSVVGPPGKGHTSA
jgi:lysophospholipase L1-like esterase